MTLERRDPWFGLARHTAARIGLGRTGGSLRSESLLEFRLAHAKARDAVHLPFDADAMAARIASLRLETLILSSATADRREYLLRPDLGRALSPSSRARLSELAPNLGCRDLALIISDGLSALASERQAVGTVEVLAPLLQRLGWTLYPIFVVPFARVKIGDEIGELLGARHSLILLGERPGLSAPDSLGAYLTHQPRSTCTDADRNCVSNIRAEGLAPAAAARKLAQLLVESARRGSSGVALKDDFLPRLEP